MAPIYWNFWNDEGVAGKAQDARLVSLVSFHPVSGEGAPLAFAWRRLRQGARDPQWGTCGYFPPALLGPLHRETK